MLKKLHKLLFANNRQGSALAAMVVDQRKQANEHKKLGDEAMKCGDLDAAERHYQDALTLYPQFDEVHNNLGVVLDRAGRFGEAVECYLAALAINPNYATACLNLGNWHKAHGNTEEQIRYFEKAISLKPDYYEAHNNLGCIFRDQGKLDEAIACFHTVLSIQEDFPIALFNLALCYRTKGNSKEEVAYLDRAIAVQPDNWVAHNQLGYALFVRGELAKAEHHFQTSLALNPDYTSAKFNLGILRLQQGNYQEGFALYESRFQDYKNHNPDYDADYFSNICRAPAWSGQDLHGKTILVWMEQGLGDNLMMMRFLPHLVNKGTSRLMLWGRPSLARLFDHVPYPVKVIGSEAELLEQTYDYHCALTSLPYLLKISIETIPSEVPYIFVPENLKHRWKDRLSTMKGKKIGLVWAGNKMMSRDFLRSIPLAAFQPLKAVPRITYISLQKAEATERLEQAEWLITDCIAECNDFLDTAALVENLDLVISVDTSTAHLCGALGKPVWLLNRFESEWRWMTDREDSPWYPTMRIFRQPALHDWTSVINHVAAELALLTIETDIVEYAA